MNGESAATHFNPRSPHGERPVPGAGSAARKSHFNPRSPHGERPGGQARRRNQHPISIHAPRTGSDDRPRRNRRGLRISIHAPRTGSDEAVLEGLLFTCQFQSTLPARGATRTATHKRRRERFQSTLPARGATAVAAPAALHGAISIHAPRTGSDGIFSRRSSSTESFQSTLPARGATP